jgi:hypothetical protein
MNRTPLTQHEHIEIGRLLKRIRQDLMNVALAVQDAYGKDFSRQYFRAAEMLTDLRADLESKLGREIVGYHVEDQHLFDVYFGATPGAYLGTDGAKRFREDLRRAK